jgi:hypothetical protein
MENLYILYANIDKVTLDLRALCDKMDKTDQNSGKLLNKLVFQFFYHKTFLTLSVFVGGKNHQGFGEDFNFILKKSDCPSQGNIANQNVYLGDLEINKSDDGWWSQLKSWIVNENYDFLVFNPELIPVDNANGNGRGGKTINYRIYPVTVDDDMCVVPTDLTSVLNTNPSPPHKGN